MTVLRGRVAVEATTVGARRNTSPVLAPPGIDPAVEGALVPALVLGAGKAAATVRRTLPAPAGPVARAAVMVGFGVPPPPPIMLLESVNSSQFLRCKCTTNSLIKQDKISICGLFVHTYGLWMLSL